MEQDILLAIEPVIDRFEALGVGYQIGGSVASSIYGVARATADVDILADLGAENVDPWVDDIENSYYVSRERVRQAVERQSSFNVIHLDTMIKVDIFVSSSDPYNQECLRRSKRDALSDVSQRQVLVASPEDVVIHKLMWYRKGGETSERQWADVQGVLRVQESNLDIGYMTLWAERLSVADLLKRAMEQAKPET